MVEILKAVVAACPSKPETQFGMGIIASDSGIQRQNSEWSSSLVVVDPPVISVEILICMDINLRGNVDIHRKGGFIVFPDI